MPGTIVGGDGEAFENNYGSNASLNAGLMNCCGLRELPTFRNDKIYEKERSQGLLAASQLSMI